MAEEDDDHRNGPPCPPGGSGKPIRGCVVKGPDDELWSVYDDEEDQGPNYSMKNAFARDEYENVEKGKKTKKPDPKDVPMKKPSSSSSALASKAKPVMKPSPKKKGK